MKAYHGDRRNRNHSLTKFASPINIVSEAQDYKELLKRTVRDHDSQVKKKAGIYQ